MHSFGLSTLERQPLSPLLLTMVRQIGEYRGQEPLLLEAGPQRLKEARAVAVARSAESASRMEGLDVPPERMNELMARRARPRTRAEQEVVGYRDLRHSIRDRFGHVAFATGIALEVHRDLFRHTNMPRGRWRSEERGNATAPGDSGGAGIEFEMSTLHRRFNAHWIEGRFERLLLIGAYTLDFLCIRPFDEGNERVAHLLGGLLLSRAGYRVGELVSLEAIAEAHRERRDRAFDQAREGWSSGGHSLLPWWEHVLGTEMLQAYRGLEARLGARRGRRGSKRAMVREAVRDLPDVFRHADIARACPTVSRPTISRALRALRDEGRIRLLSAGRDAEWAKVAKG